jgi:hypothetical protein
VLISSVIATAPIEVTDRTLSDEARLRVWIYVHRQRKQWDAKEKQMVAYQLIQLSWVGQWSRTFSGLPIESWIGLLKSSSYRSASKA